MFIRDNQNSKFLHWALIFIGNLPVDALHALLVQYLFIPSSHFKNFFCTNSAESLFYFSVTVNAPYFTSMEKYGGYKGIIVTI